MRWRTLLITAFLAHFLAQAQVQSSTKPPLASSRSQPKFQDLEAQKLADQAVTLPPELKADALIRITEAKSITESAKQKKRLLSEAFESAMHAKYEALPIGLTTRSTDSDVGALEASVGQGLDRLSLQTRVVSAMASIDVKVAENLLRQVVIPSPKPLTCNDTVDYRSTSFYEAALAVLKNEASTAEKQRAVAEWLVGTAQGPKELEPVFRTIRTAQLADVLKSQLFGDIAVRMGGMKIDDPRTASEVLNFGLSQAVFDALDTEKEIGAQTLLMTSYRSFIANNIGSVCSDDSAFVERINRIWWLLGRKSERLGIPAEDAPKLDVKPEVVDANVHVYLFWQQNGSKEIMDGYRHLADKTQREKPEWDAQLQLFLDQFRHWQQESHEPDGVRFDETCIIYAALLEIIPPGETADHIMTEYVGYLQSSSLLFDDPPLWDLQVVRLIHQCCSHPQSAQATKTADISRYVIPQSAMGVIAALNAALTSPTTVAMKPK